MSQNFQSERLIDALIKTDRYQADQVVRQMRSKQHDNHGKGDVTTNGAAVRHTDPAHCSKKHRYGWL